MDGSPWDRVRRLDPLIWDSLLAAVILIVSILGAVLGRDAPAGATTAALGPEAYVLLVIGCVPIAFRRKWPISVLAVVGAASTALAFRDHGTDLAVSLVIASFTAAAHVDRERFLRVVVPIATAAAVGSLMFAYPRTNWVEVSIGTTFFVGLPMIFGRIGFNRRRRIVVDRERAARDAVTAERARIARELHDVVAHAMSVMVVQAGAARTVVDRDTEAAKAAIARIEETGRDGMTEMRRLIGVLKDDGADAELAPQPGLDQLDALLDTVRDAGVPVEAVTRGESRPVSPGVDLTAYRVVQEALTNVIKHAGRASARVVLSWVDDALEVEVADDGHGKTWAETVSPGQGPIGQGPIGQGLIGMRERVALYGGSLETGGRPGGGFVVRVHLPLDGTAKP
ncbi:MAG: sensor histidine kinase [Actinomycetota bacterium]